MLARSLIVLALLPVCASAQLLFGPTASAPLQSTQVPMLAAGDVDGDGLADIVLGHAGAPGLRVGDGAGGFEEEIVMDTDAVGSSVALADLDGDGLLDLLAGSSSSHHLDVAINQGGGTFAPATTYNLGVTTIGGNLLAIRTGDGDGDGDLDVLAVTRGAFAQPSGEARMFRNLGDGTLGNVGAIVPTGFTTVADGAVLSLNGDTRPDLVVVYNSGVQLPVLQVVAAVCNLDGSFSGTASFALSSLAGTGDLDGDTDVDLLLLAVPGGLGNPPPSLVTSQLNLGTGGFATGPSFDLPLTNGFLLGGVADLDADGQADVAIQEQFPAELRALRGGGDGSFDADGAHVSLSATVTVTQGFLADFDGDGRTDWGGLIGAGTPSPTLVTSMNRTYPAGGPLLDLGHQLEGQKWPIQIATGSFAGGTPFSFKLSGAPAGGSAFHIVGFSELSAPFKGGTLVPSPFLITGPWPVNGQGQATIAGSWPNGPSGLQILAQFWMADAAGPAGFAASSCVRIVTQ